jgi:predicted enzyme related to lactoylglutathione lyase
MRAFYESTFGWKTEQLGPDMGDYVLVTTTETDPSRRPKMPGMINGGFYQKRNDWPAQYPSVVIAVDDIKASMKKVADAGGKVLGEPMEIPGYGLYVSFFDSEVTCLTSRRAYGLTNRQKKQRISTWGFSQGAAGARRLAG